MFFFTFYAFSNDIIYTFKNTLLLLTKSVYIIIWFFMANLRENFQAYSQANGINIIVIHIFVLTSKFSIIRDFPPEKKNKNNKIYVF